MSKTTRCVCATIIILLVNGMVLADHGGGTDAFSLVPSAIPSEHKTTTVTMRYEYTRFEDRNDVELQSMALRSEDGHVEAIDNVGRLYLDLSHGITHNFSIGISFSTQNVDNYREMHDEGGGLFDRPTGNPSGFEDIWISSLYRIQRGNNYQTALLGGVKLPTGDNRNRLTTGTIIGLGSQPSSGSLDVMIGLAHTREIGKRLRADLGLTYIARGEGPRNRSLGNRLEAGANFSYRINSDANATWNWEGTLGITARHNRPQREAGVNHANSGGTSFFASPGLSAQYERWSFGILAPIPVSQELNQVQQKMDYQIIGSVGYTFGGGHAEEHEHH